MCTVLVDGQAARACLLFAVQLDGAEITTVEGLGRPDALHPLQEAFGRHHALQCGFCTPGFLMSSYDLLADRPDVPPEDLPAEFCLPGAELTEELGHRQYAGRARVSVGPIKPAFRGVAQILEHDRQAGRLRVFAQGQDTGGAQTQAEIVLRTLSHGISTELRVDARVYLTGRIARFGRALAGDVSRRMFEQFAAAVAQAATSGKPPEGPVKAPSALRLMWASLLDRLRRANR